MTIDFQPLSAPTSQIDFQPLEKSSEDFSPKTDIPSKVLAGVGSFTQGALKGVGQTLEAVPNIAASAVGEGLDLLNKAGIVPDSTVTKYNSGLDDIRNKVENIGNKILEFQGRAAEPDIKKNPTISKYSNLAGNISGSSLAAGSLVGKLGQEMNPVTSGILTQGVQGALMGAGGNSENPLSGAAIGSAIGGVAGGIAGKLDRSAQIINDKIDDALRIGKSPMSEAGIKSIKGALDDNGKALTTEEVERSTKLALQAKLDSVAPKVDITQKPTDIISNLAMSNYPKVKAARDALYEPLNKSEAISSIDNLKAQIAQMKDKLAINALPDDLSPNPKLSDLMTYRRQVSTSINQAEKAIKTGSSAANIKTLDELMKIKQAVTTDLNISAEKVGLDGQLQQADAFHLNNFKPFEVYNTKSGKLLSPKDATDTWTRVSKLLRPRLPNLTAMSQVASTLGPQGKQIFGYAYLQQAVERSMNVDGRIFPSKISMELNKLQNTGLAQHILTPELKEAFDGMRNIAEGAIKTTRGMSNKQQGIISNFVNNLTHNSGGITLLRTLGSKTTPPAKIKNIISQILLNALEKNALSTLKQEEQQ